MTQLIKAKLILIRNAEKEKEIARQVKQILKVLEKKIIILISFF